MALAGATGSTEYAQRTGGTFPSTPMTVCLWARMTATHNGAAIYGHRDSGSYVYFYNPSGDGVSFSWENSAAGNPRLNDITFTVGVWYFCSIIWTGLGAGQTTQYWKAAGDTVFSGGDTDTFSDPVTANAPNIIVLNNDFSPTTGWFDGRVAALKIWTAALTQDELWNESMQYMPVRTANLHQWHPFHTKTVAGALVDFSGNARDFTETGTLAIEDGPPIAWSTSKPTLFTEAADTFMIGTTTIDFGSFPGRSDSSVTVTGQTGIATTDLAEAWLRLEDTADHSANEHFVDGPEVWAGNIIAGTGFTIYARARDLTPPVPDAIQLLGNAKGFQEHGRVSPMVYGQWKVNWAWATP